MNGRAGLPPVLVSLVLLMLGGCIPADSGGALPAPGAPGGDGGEVGGGGTGDAGTDDGSQTAGEPGAGDAAGGDGMGDDVGTNGEDDTSEEITPPTVTLVIADTTTTPGNLIFLSCSVADSGGGLVSAYSFTSTAGADTITHDGVSATATAYVPIGLYSITYTCSAANEAGQGPASNPVTVTVGGG